MKHMEFPNYKVYETTLGGRKLKVELGKMAGLANGAALVSFGDTTILACATMAKTPRAGIDFLPAERRFRGKALRRRPAFPAALCAAKAAPVSVQFLPPA